jgi:hypothetical protein
MPCSRGKDDDVTGRYPGLTAAASTELNRRAAARNAEDFVRLRVKMEKIVDSVAPGVFPAVRSEEHFKDGGRIECRIERDGRAIDQKRESGIVRRLAVVGEFEFLPACASDFDLFRQRPAQARGFFDEALCVFEERHEIVLFS